MGAMDDLIRRFRLAAKMTVSRRDTRASMKRRKPMPHRTSELLDMGSAWNSKLNSRLFPAVAKRVASRQKMRDANFAFVPLEPTLDDLSIDVDALVVTPSEVKKLKQASDVNTLVGVWGGNWTSTRHKGYELETHRFPWIQQAYTDIFFRNMFYINLMDNMMPGSSDITGKLNVPDLSMGPDSLVKTRVVELLDRYMFDGGQFNNVFRIASLHIQYESSAAFVAIVKAARSLLFLAKMRYVEAYRELGVFAKWLKDKRAEKHENKNEYDPFGGFGSDSD